jgi:transposase
MSASPDNRLWVGIDLAKKPLEAAVCPEGFEPARWRTLEVRGFETTAAGRRAFAAWLGAQSGEIVGTIVESTGSLSARLADGLGAMGLVRPVIVNPHFALAFAKSLGVREKTDRVDAATLAVFAATHRPQARREPTPSQRDLRELSRQRRALVDERTAWRARRAEAIGSLARRNAAAMVRAPSARLEATAAAMAQVVGSDASLARQVRLLTTIPGIGPVIAQTLVAELGDLGAWGRREIVSYAGLFPREHTSGTSVRRPARLAKGCGGAIRRALYLAAISLRRGHTPLQAFASRLERRGKSKMCAVGAMMRKLLLVARVVVRTGEPYDPTLNAI